MSFQRAIFDVLPKPTGGSVNIDDEREFSRAAGITDDRTHPGLREIRPDGQQEVYLVLSNEERAKGFIRPVRTTYRHRGCGGVTSMGRALAETYARDPAFYSGTFCAICGQHFSLVTLDGERAFVWVPDGTGVGE